MREFFIITNRTLRLRAKAPCRYESLITLPGGEYQRRGAFALVRLLAIQEKENYESTIRWRLD